MDVQHENGVLMSKILISLLFATSVFAVQEGKTHRYHITVDGMVCNYCVESIRLRMKKNKEVKDVKIDFDKKLVLVITEPGRDIATEKIEQSIRDTGYVPKDIKKLD